MFGSTFYHSLTRKYVTYFGTLFNDIVITRTASNNSVQTIKVPLSYSPANKMIERINQFGNLEETRDIAVQLPRMGFEIINISYDPQRHLNTLNKNVAVDSNGTSASFQYVPVPYNISFLLSIYVKNTEDGSKIIEQIIPYFAPDWVESMTLVPEVPIIYDIPVSIRDVALRDNYEGNNDANRYMIWSVTFEMKAWFFGSTRQRNLIKQAIATIFSETGESVITVEPSLEINGQPVPYLEINSNDPYGYAVSFEDRELNASTAPQLILEQFTAPEE